MDKTLKSAIERLDAAAVQDFLKDDIDLTGVTLSFVIEQWGEADEDTFWGYSSLEGGFRSTSEHRQTKGSNSPEAHRSRSGL